MSPAQTVTAEALMILREICHRTETKLLLLFGQQNFYFVHRLPLGLTALPLGRSQQTTACKVSNLATPLICTDYEQIMAFYFKWI